MDNEIMTCPCCYAVIRKGLHGCPVCGWCNHGFGNITPLVKGTCVLCGGSTGNMRPSAEKAERIRAVYAFNNGLGPKPLEVSAALKVPTAAAEDCAPGKTGELPNAVKMVRTMNSEQLARFLQEKSFTGRPDLRAIVSWAAAPSPSNSHASNSAAPPNSSTAQAKEPIAVIQEVHKMMESRVDPAIVQDIRKMSVLQLERYLEQIGANENRELAELVLWVAASVKKR